MGKKVAVVLSGCGYLDGAEIRESVITLLALVGLTQNEKIVTYTFNLSLYAGIRLSSFFLQPPQQVRGDKGECGVTTINTNFA